VDIDCPGAGEVAYKEILDAAIVGSAQAVGHYEMARYGTLIAWAEALGHDDNTRLLTSTRRSTPTRSFQTVAVCKGVNRKAAS